MKTIKKNMILTMGQQIVLMISGFIIPQLILKVYGPQIHGLVSTITNILSYVALLSGGIVTIASQALYDSLVKKDINKINGIFAAIKNSYFKISIYYLLAVLIAAIVLPIFLKSDLNRIMISSLMIVMGATTILDCFLAGALRALLQADKKIYIIATSTTIAVIIRIILQIILIMNNASIIFVQLVLGIVPVINSIVFIIYQKKHYKYLNKNSKPIEKALSQKNAGLIHQISGVIVNNTDTVILSTCGNLTLTSIYSVYQLVFSALYSVIINVFSYGVVADFGHLLISDKNKLRNKFKTYEFIFFKITSVIYATAAAMILTFVDLYTQNVNFQIKYVDGKIAVLFVIIGILNTSRIPGGMLINAAGHYKKTQYRAILEAIINITVSIVLVKKYLIEGVLVGTVCSFMYRTVDIIMYSNKNILNTNNKKTFKNIFQMLLVIILTSIISSKVNFEVTTWMKWGMVAIIFGGISTILTLIIVILLDFGMARKLYIQVKKKIISKIMHIK